MIRSTDLKAGSPPGRIRPRGGPGKRFVAIIGILAIGLMSAGAGPKDGVTLFETGNYSEARRVLGDALAQAPEDPRLHFFLGRTLLAMEDGAAALPHLEKAVRLAPGDATYHFWLGVNYWALLDLENELAAYERALAIDPTLWPAHVYAGHNQFDRGNWASALGHYTTVLGIIPDHPEALYNAGKALKELGRAEEAVAVWRQYVQHHRTGELAIDTVRFLNAAGDFGYRAFAVGDRFVAGPSPGIGAGRPEIEPLMGETLEEIGSILRTDEALTLHIVAFVEGDSRKAAGWAKALKRAFIANFPDTPGDRVRVSWFDKAETVHVDDKPYMVDASINMFTVKAGQQQDQGAVSD